MQLDEIDKQILNILLQAGRESLSNISIQVHKADQNTMSHTGIAKRISKLEDAEILKVQGNLSIEGLNYYLAFILMEMKNYSEVKKIIEQYSECPRVFLLAHITGQYNLIFGVVGQNMDVLRNFISLCGPTNKNGVLHSAVMFVSELKIPKYMPLNLFSQVSHENRCENICKYCTAFLDGNCQGCGNF